MLRSNQEFEFDKLYKNYLTISAKLFPIYWNVQTEPFKVVMGENVQKALDGGNRLTHEIKTNAIDHEHLEEVIKNYCQHLKTAEIAIIYNETWVQLLNRGQEECVKGVGYDLHWVNATQGIDFSTYTNENNKLDYVSSVIYGFSSVEDMEYPGFNFAQVNALAEFYYND